jgi:hypothetical protein
MLQANKARLAAPNKSPLCKKIDVDFGQVHLK